MKALSNIFGFLSAAFMVIMITALFTTTTTSHTAVDIMLASLILGCLCALIFVYCDKQANKA